ncbi:hypothetical protein [Herbaspirillum sp. ST 5-3]|uniref:type II secretion system protein n=1 Tax=Oxalobacteraceae TaxID=75682 RepID=UPI0010A4A3E1|nr:hypothetical protein [Herbaspirillum sp. ST 5-3]
MLELLSVFILIGIFATFLLDRLTFYQEAAEKANVEYTIANLRSALRIQMAVLISQGRMRDFALLEQQNPMDWLEYKPANYRLVSRDSSHEPGYWQFSTDDRTLTYWLAYGNHFQTDKPEGKRIRLRVRLIRDASSPQGETESPVLTVRLELVEPYTWFK